MTMEKLTILELCTLLIGRRSGSFNVNTNMPQGWTQDIVENLEEKKLLKYVGDGDYVLTRKASKMMSLIELIMDLTEE